MPKTTKADFVRSHPNLSAQEVIAKAKESKMSLTAGHVYAIRSEAKKSKGKGKGKVAAKVAKTTSSKPSTAMEDFVRSVKLIGVERARDLLDLIDAYER